MSSHGPFHAGELAVQERAGVRATAARVGQSIHPFVPAGANAFLSACRTAVLGGRDRDGRMWASAVEGPPGFLAVLAEGPLRVGALPPATDPLSGLRSGDAVGVVVLDPETRRRMRVNGTAELPGDGTLRVHAAQAFANCPKYIHRRVLEAETAAPPRRARSSAVLDAGQMARVARADTFFVASVHPEAGADASHRGGEPGFVRVVDARTLVWPDYAGNTMFQTLGNLHVDPAAGLLFPGFEDGTALQLSGRARVVWDAARVRAVPGAERLVEMTVEAVVETAGASALRWRLVERSPHDPPA